MHKKVLTVFGNGFKIEASLRKEVVQSNENWQ
jgi:hypothetical protein